MITGTFDIYVAFDTMNRYTRFLNNCHPWDLAEIYGIRSHPDYIQSKWNELKRTGNLWTMLDIPHQHKLLKMLYSNDDCGCREVPLEGYCSRAEDYDRKLDN